MFGIYDTLYDCWMGSDERPFQFFERDLAQASCQILATMVTGSDLCTRFEVRPLPPGLVRTDTQPIQITAEKSLRRIEGDLK